MEGRQGAGRGPAALDFGAYLRTGRLVAMRGPVEVKFNPYHDPRNGQFTFAPGGGSAREIGRINLGWESPRGRSAAPVKKPAAKPSISSKIRASGRVGVGDRVPTRWDSGGFSGGGGGSAGGGGASSTEVWPAKAPTAVRRGANVAAAAPLPHSGGAATGRATHPSQLPGRKTQGVAKTTARTGTVRRPANPAPTTNPAVAAAAVGASAASAAAAVSAAAAAGAAMAGTASAGVLPAGWQIVNANGYNFKLNDFNRPEDMWGKLTRNDAQGRSKKHQSEAGGKDRLPTDEGGHFWARRFNGPKEAFNHFAQDMKFNRGQWRAMENKWDAADKAGKEVWVRMTPRYQGRSMRPYEVTVQYKIDGVTTRVTFPNGGN